MVNNPFVVKLLHIVGTFHILPFGRLEKTATRLLRTVLNRSLRRFDAVISVSPAAQAFAKKSLGLKSGVLPNVVKLPSTTKRSVKSKAGKLNVSFLGRLVSRKGCQHLLEIIHLLPGSLKQQLVVRIGGRGPDESKLRRLSRRLGLTEYVEFVGFVDEAKKFEFLAAADLAVFPATGGESFGIVLIEAMASGAGVVVGGDNPGYSSVLDEVPQTLFNPVNHRASAEQLELLLRDAALRKKIHTAQQKLVQRYDVDKVGPKLVEIYTKALHKRREMR